MAGIVIVGTGEMAREADAVLGFLDDDPGTHGTEVAGLRVLDTRQWLEDDGHTDVEVVVALGGPAARAIQGVTIGERAVIGAGAVVIRDVEPDSAVVGVPARPIGGSAA